MRTFSGGRHLPLAQTGRVFEHLSGRDVPAPSKASSLYALIIVSGSASDQICEKDRKSKDRWEKFQIIATAMVPVMLAIFGYYYTQTMKEAELASAREISDREQTIASINARVGQAQLVDSLMAELLSDDSKRKQLAIKAVLVFLKEEGQELVAAISRSDPNPQVRQYAATTLMDRRSQLIGNMFAQDAELRKSSTAELVSRLAFRPATDT